MFKVFANALIPLFPSTSMAKPEKRTRERIGSSPSYFLGCFGFSRKKYSERPKVSPDGGEKKRKKKKNWLVSKCMFRLKKGETEPPLIEETEKSDKQKTVPVISRMTDRKNVLAVDKAAILETQKTSTNEQRDGSKSKSADPVSSPRDDTCQKRAKPDPTRVGEYGSIPGEERKKERRSRVGKYDPVVGISIIMVTLGIMVIWGRLCAILCASAWCYFLPRIRNAVAAKHESRGVKSSGSDLNSEAYKRKVILEGFLGREK